MLPTILEAAGVVLVAAAAAFVAVPLALAVLGAGLILFGLAAERDA